MRNAIAIPECDGDTRYSYATRPTPSSVVAIYAGLGLVGRDPEHKSQFNDRCGADDQNDASFDGRDPRPDRSCYGITVFGI